MEKKDFQRKVDSAKSAAKESVKSTLKSVKKNVKSGISQRLLFLYLWSFGLFVPF